MRSDKIISSVDRYCSLLEFLKDNHPKVLEEWSNGPQATTTTQTLNAHQSTFDQKSEVTNAKIR